MRGRVLHEDLIFRWMENLAEGTSMLLNLKMRGGGRDALRYNLPVFSYKKYKRGENFRVLGTIIFL